MKFELIVFTPNLGLSSKKVDRLNLQMSFLFLLVKSQPEKTFSYSSNEFVATENVISNHVCITIKMEISYISE